jgi:hypothetical protein
MCFQGVASTTIHEPVPSSHQYFFPISPRPHDSSPRLFGEPISPRPFDASPRLFGEPISPRPFDASPRTLDVSQRVDAPSSPRYDATSPRYDLPSPRRLHESGSRNSDAGLRLEAPSPRRLQESGSRDVVLRLDAVSPRNADRHGDVSSRHGDSSHRHQDRHHESRQKSQHSSRRDSASSAGGGASAFKLSSHPSKHNDFHKQHMLAVTRVEDDKRGASGEGGRSLSSRSKQLVKQYSMAVPSHAADFRASAGATGGSYDSNKLHQHQAQQPQQQPRRAKSPLLGAHRSSKGDKPTSHSLELAAPGSSRRSAAKAACARKVKSYEDYLGDYDYDVLQITEFSRGPSFNHDYNLAELASPTSSKVQA